MPKRTLQLVATILLCQLPFSAFAAQATSSGPPSAQADPLSVAGILAMGVGFFILAVVLYLSFLAIFVHAASRIAGLYRPFGTAFYAVFLNIVFQLFFSVVISLIAGQNNGGYLLASWGSATAAVMVAYKAGFLKSIVVAILAVVLTIVFFVITALVLLATFSHKVPVSG